MSRSRQLFRYQQLVGEIEAKITNGTYKAGEKLPSIRKLQKQLNLSISTIYKAYMELETLGLIEARPQSGYYVSPVSLNQLQPPLFDKISSSLPQKVTLGSMVNSVVAAINDPRMVTLGSSHISSELLPYKPFSRIVKGISAHEMKSLISYSLTEGNPELRRQLALRSLGMFEEIESEDIIITNGCMEAVMLSLLSVIQAGDTVAVEAPTHFGFLQLFKELGIMVAEVPTDPRHGVDTNELEKIINRYKIKACLFMPNFHNPLGTLMPDAAKKKLVELLNRHEIPVVEDDIYSELYFDEKRPTPLKTFDQKGLVLTCSSFSKTLAPGLRIGWIIAGKRFKEKIQRLKAGTNVATSTLDQYLLARYLSSGAYERHLRSLRNALKKQTIQTALAVRKYFPRDIRLAVPRGGGLLWIELHPDVDALDVYHKALNRHISILPGIVCSASGRFKNHIRIGCGSPFTKDIEQAIATLGSLIDESRKGRTDMH